MSAIDFNSSLNSEQLTAVTASDGPLLVLAAAGTGKTRTLVYRVAWLVEHGITPDRILLLTFTNRAAGEMLERAESLVGKGVGGMWGGTFHHMANRMLRQHAPLLGYNPGYTILDRDDSRQLMRNCLEDQGLNLKEFPNADVLLGISGSAANTGTLPGDLLNSRFQEYGTFAERILRILQDYEDRKRRQGAMDFDDLLVNALDLLTQHGQVRESYQHKFKHILVDEYQDTNPIQAKLVDHIAAGHGNLLVVGDDFQSIYAWRGASIDNIMTFTKRYSKARLFKLETNYRSVPEILYVANACIAGNPAQYQKTLRPTREPYKRPVIALVRDGEQQARYVLDQVERLLREGLKRSGIAVLYRAHYHAMELQMLLTRESIPYLITSGVRFFEQAHIRDVCSVVRIHMNDRDELAFSRLLCMLPRVGARTALKIWERLDKTFKASDPDARKRLYDQLPAAARESWRQIEPVFEQCGTQGTGKQAGEIIHCFLEAFYAKHAANLFENWTERSDDVRELILYASKFATPEDFLTEMALYSNLDAEVADAGEAPKSALRLSTVHQAKGLEWDAVIVLWATEGMFPSARALAESSDGDAEERRLFYVAVTRAKDELMFCVPEMRRKPDGGVIPQRPSRFIAELPADLVHRVYVRH